MTKTVDQSDPTWERGQEIANKLLDTGNEHHVAWLREQAEIVATTMPDSDMFNFAHGVLTTLDERAQEVSS